MTPIKVKETEMYRDYLVCKGKLVFVNSDEPEVVGKTMIMNKDGYCAILQWAINEYPKVAQWRKVKPVIISLTEEFGVGDTIANSELGIGKVIAPKGTAGTYWICDFEKNHTTARHTVTGIFKVLALPEHFSATQLEAMSNNHKDSYGVGSLSGAKLRDEDEVFLMCEWKDNDYNQGSEYKIKVVRLTNNHINIFKPYKKEILRTPMLDFLRDYIKNTPLEQRQKEWDEICRQVRNGEADEYAYGEKSIEALPKKPSDKVCVNCLQKTDTPHQIDENGNCIGAWNDIEQEYLTDHPPFGGPYPDFLIWLKDYYNAPTKKK